MLGAADYRSEVKNTKIRKLPGNNHIPIELLDNNNNNDEERTLGCVEQGNEILYD